jgi:hypothetical protein
VEKDEKVYVEWLEKAVSQNNPIAMELLGHWLESKKDYEREISCYLSAVELGWVSSVPRLVKMLFEGIGCEKDMRQAAIWGARVNAGEMWQILYSALFDFMEGKTECLGCNLDQLCYSLGYGLFWFIEWSMEVEKESRDFGDGCRDYYCSCLELQQESIFTFLLCWNRTVGVKGPGKIIGKMVWEGRENNLIKVFGKPEDLRWRIFEKRKVFCYSLLFHLFWLVIF